VCDAKHVRCLSFMDMRRTEISLRGNSERFLLSGHGMLCTYVYIYTGHNDDMSVSFKDIVSRLDGTGSLEYRITVFAP